MLCLPNTIVASLFLNTTSTGAELCDFVVELALGGSLRWNVEGVGEHPWETTRRGFILDESLLEHTTSSRSVLGCVSGLAIS